MVLGFFQTLTMHALHLPYLFFCSETVNAGLFFENDVIDDTSVCLNNRKIILHALTIGIRDHLHMVRVNYDLCSSF